MSYVVPPAKTIQNACNTPLNEKNGFVPQMATAIQNYYQPVTFILIKKAISGGFLVESGDSGESWTSPEGEVIQGLQVSFLATGLIPKQRSLGLNKEGQRKWSGWDFYAQPQVVLKVDDCFIYQNVQYRVMAVWDYRLYQFMQYSVAQDYTFSGPLQQVMTNPDGFGNRQAVIENGQWVIL